VVTDKLHNLPAVCCLQAEQLFRPSRWFRLDLHQAALLSQAAVCARGTHVVIPYP
jgi:hypothetical protein